MKNKHSTFLVLAIEVVFAALWAFYLFVGNNTQIFVPMAAVTVVSLSMLLLCPELPVVLITLLMTEGIALQISIGDLGHTPMFLLAAAGIGLTAFVILNLFGPKLLSHNKLLRLASFILMIGIFAVNFLFSHAVGSEEVTGFVTIAGVTITIFQFLIPVHLLFLGSYIGIRHRSKSLMHYFIGFHIVEALCFFLSKEMGTLVLLYTVTLAFLLILEPKFGNFVFLTVLKKPAFYGVIILAGIAVLINHFITLPGIGTAINHIVNRLFYADPYQLQTAKNALAISRFANTEGGFVSIPAAANDFAFVSLTMRLGIAMGYLTMLAYFALLILSVVHLKSHDTVESSWMFLIMFTLTASSLITIAGSLGVLPIVGMPVYFLSRGGSYQVVSIFLVYLYIYMSRKEQNHETYR